MKFVLYTVLLVVLPLQAQMAFNGSVVDAVTGEPLPFVNIGVVDRAIGTVSDEDGNFLLEFRREKVGPADFLRISSLGYESTEIPLSRLEQSRTHFTFRLKPAPIGLDEVMVSTAELFEVEEEVGYPDMMGRGIGYWKDSVALGGELGSRIRVTQGLRRLNALFFQVLDNPSDSVQLRVNIYKTDIKSTYPGTKANKSGKSILHTLRKGESLVVIDLSYADIWVSEDFIISLELLGVYGTERVGQQGHLPEASLSGGTPVNPDGNAWRNLRWDLVFKVHCIQTIPAGFPRPGSSESGKRTKKIFPDMSFTLATRLEKHLFEITPETSVSKPTNGADIQP